MATAGDSRNRDAAWPSQDSNVHRGSGLLTFASVVMFLSGTFHLISGASAIEDGTFLVIEPNYIFDVSAETWGRLHVAGGVLLIVGAFFLLGGGLAARNFALVVATLSAMGNFLSVPYAPEMSCVMIILASAVIIALAAYQYPKDISEV